MAKIEKYAEISDLTEADELFTYICKNVLKTPKNDILRNIYGDKIPIPTLEDVAWLIRNHQIDFTLKITFEEEVEEKPVEEKKEPISNFEKAISETAKSIEKVNDDLKPEKKVVKKSEPPKIEKSQNDIPDFD